MKADNPMQQETMTRYIALLRGINVGGNKKVGMAALKALLESIGLADVQTLLQSGNVVFSSADSDAAALTTRIEAAILDHFGFEVRVILRSAAQWQAVASQHPYTADQLAEPSKILVMLLSSAPQADAVDTLRQAISGTEQVTLSGDTLYLFYPDGMGRSKVDNALVDRKLKVLSTGRNWNTVMKLLALVEGA